MKIAPPNPWETLNLRPWGESREAAMRREISQHQAIGRIGKVGFHQGPRKNRKKS